MGYVEAIFPDGNAVRIQNGDALKLGRLTYCDGCQSYEITEFGREITDETGTLGVLWMCGKCLIKVEKIKMQHNWTGIIQGINSGLCKCNFHGEIISSHCTCGEFHSWCRKCWVNV